MTRYITLDLGTTKSKISLVEDGAVKGSLRISSRLEWNEYRSKLGAAIAELLEKAGLSEGDITAILATGTMASAEMGIYPLEHAVAPIGPDGIKATAVTVSIPEISGIPFFITRGVKALDHELRTKDMMRGEEAEIYGLGCDGEGIYMLMGSHTKIVTTDKNGKITDISTMLTGELASVIISETILRYSVSFEDSSVKKEELMRGFEYARDNSLGEALFRVRVLRGNHGADASEAYSFFIGALLSGEVGYVLKSKPQRVTVSGNKRLREALSMLLREYTGDKIISISDEESEMAVSIGLLKIFEYAN